MTRLTPNAAAARCGKSRATIIRAIAAKALPAEKQGSQWAIQEKDLDRWAAPVSYTHLTLPTIYSV